MQQWIMEWMNSFGYWGIALLIVLENVFPPIPSEIILTFGGFMTTYTRMTIPMVILFSTAGSVAGALILYAVGRLLPRERLERLVDGKIGKILRFKRQDVEMAMGWFDRKGYLTVLFCRCIPVVRSLISIPAGTARMPMLPFLLLTAIGTAVWDTVLIGIGAAAGSSWQLPAARFDYQSALLLMAAFSVAVVVLPLWLLKRKRAKREKERRQKC